MPRLYPPLEVGQKFHRLTVKKVDAFQDPKSGRHLHLCECDCGTVKLFNKNLLLKGKTKSCGCWNRDRFFKHGNIHLRSYDAWRGMKDRCNNPNSEFYRHYGGRGISYSPLWEDYEVFRRYIGEPSVGESLDRIDVNGNYEPGNCRWASQRIQSNNTRKTIMISFGDISVPLRYVAQASDIPYMTLYRRMVSQGTIFCGRTQPNQDVVRKGYELWLKELNGSGSIK